MGDISVFLFAKSNCYVADDCPLVASIFLLLTFDAAILAEGCER
jgi:hypothetical protein